MAAAAMGARIAACGRRAAAAATGPRRVRRAGPRVGTRRCAAAAEASEGGEEYDYDVFTIGAGSGGVRASRMAAAAGARVAVCEMPYDTKASETTGGVGGTCVIRGCVPKKLLMYGSEYSHAFKDCEGFGWSIPEQPTHDWRTLIFNKNTELDRLHGIYLRLLDGSGVELKEGRGLIVDPHTVEVDGERFTAKTILVAVGGRAYVPDIPGAEHVLTSDDALDLPEMPKSIVIVGGGYIALEFACIFAGLGAKVDVVYRQPLPLRGFDEEVRTFLAEQLEVKGITIHKESSPEAVEKLEDGSMVLKTTTGDIKAEAVMFATGRKPNTGKIGAAEIGLEMADNGAIKVDEYSQTSVPSIYAVGDVTDRINLTPVALMEGMAFVSTVIKGVPQVPDHENVPAAVFTQPPVATVGMTEEQATEKLGDVDIYTSSFRPMKHTISGSQERAFMKLIVDAATDKVVGCHMVGEDAGEIMQGIAVAIKCGATKKQFDSTVGIHPTAAEELVTMRTVSREVRTAAEPAEAVAAQ